ncbi:MAG: SpoIID/LytB domain-containing protein [Acidimicrobiales bacterium]
MTTLRRRGRAWRPRSVRMRRAVLSVTAATVALGAVTAAPDRATAAVPDTFVIVGSGFGHGVGMSQYGSYGQALEGASAAQIVQHYYTGTTVAPATDAVPLRVSLHDTLPSAQIRGEPVSAGGPGGSLQITVGSGAAPVAGAPGQVFDLSVAPDGTHVAVTSAGTPVGSGSGDIVGVTWGGAGGSTLLDVAGTGQSLDDSPTAHRYRYGTLDVAVVGGALQVVNQLSLHGEYLRGIAEVPSSWSPAALQAQVIAARSYARFKLDAGLRPACRCHLFSDTRDQVFAGWAKEAEPTYGARWAAAVDATQPDATTGQTVLANGAVVEAFYFSSSGGHTENNEDGFGGSPLPWLRSVDDHWSLLPAVHNPEASWTRTRTQAQLAAAFRLPDVATVSFDSRTTGGSVRTATAVSSNGTVSHISGASFRDRLGLPGAWIAKPVLRLAGADRFATSVAISQAVSAGPAGSTSGSTTSSTSSPGVSGGPRPVVIASGEDAHLVDGLVAGPLARVKGASLLLATSTGLPAAVAAEIDRLHPGSAVLVGGTTALGAGVRSDLRAHGLQDSQITQLSGNDRFDTAAAAARAMGGPRPSAVIASGDAGHLADALAAGGPAGTAGQPVLLVSAGGVPAATAQALRDLAVQRTAVAGGPASVPDAVLAQLPNPVRLAGDTRDQTALHVADHFLATAATPENVVVLASGADSNLPDALAGAAIGRITLLTTPDRLDPDSAYWLAGHPEVGGVDVLGGTGAVSDAALADVRSAVGG